MRRSPSRTTPSPPKRFPEAFDGFIVAQVSDLHNAEFGEGSAQLLDRLRAASPDLIAVTGDLIDARRADVGAAMAFIRGAVKSRRLLCSGRPEARSDAFESLEAQLAEAGVHVLKMQWNRSSAAAHPCGSPDWTIPPSPPAQILPV